MNYEDEDYGRHIAIMIRRRGKKSSRCNEKLWGKEIMGKWKAKGHRYCKHCFVEGYSINVGTASRL